MNTHEDLLKHLRRMLRQVARVRQPGSSEVGVRLGSAAAAHLTQTHVLAAASDRSAGGTLMSEDATLPPWGITLFDAEGDLHHCADFDALVTQVYDIPFFEAVSRRPSLG